jgi:cytosine/uracil/thiamine/allantoin permease
MGPLAACLVGDYYLIKKRKLNVHELYTGEKSIYWYDHGVNWRAFLAFFIGVGPLLPGFAKSIQNDLKVGGAWK